MLTPTVSSAASAGAPHLFTCVLHTAYYILHTVPSYLLPTPRPRPRPRTPSAAPTLFQRRTSLPPQTYESPRQPDSSRPTVFPRFLKSTALVSGPHSHSHIPQQVPQTYTGCRQATIQLPVASPVNRPLIHAQRLPLLPPQLPRHPSLLL